MFEKDKSHNGNFFGEWPKNTQSVGIIENVLLPNKEINILDRELKTGPCDRSYIQERLLVEGALMAKYFLE